jgi:hypothetical protein
LINGVFYKERKMKNLFIGLLLATTFVVGCSNDTKTYSLCKGLNSQSCDSSGTKDSTWATTSTAKNYPVSKDAKLPVNTATVTKAIEIYTQVDEETGKPQKMLSQYLIFEVDGQRVGSFAEGKIKEMTSNKIVYEIFNSSCPDDLNGTVRTIKYKRVSDDELVVSSPSSPTKAEKSATTFKVPDAQDFADASAAFLAGGDNAAQFQIDQPLSLKPSKRISRNQVAHWTCLKGQKWLDVDSSAPRSTQLQDSLVVE